MKLKLFIVFLVFLAIFAGAQSLDREIRKLAVDITRSYMESHGELLIKPRLGVADFKEETEDAAKNSVGSLAAVLLTDEFSRSAVFSIIERKNLDLLMEEYKLNLSGFTDTTTAPEIGNLQGIELLLVGSVSGAGNRYLISARLVDVETGQIAAGSSIEVARSEIEQEAQRYIASTFQSPFGIILAPSVTPLFELSSNNNALTVVSIDAGYRLSKWLSLSLGYVHTQSAELHGMDSDKISVQDDELNYHDTTRYFTFSGDGIKLAGEFTLSPTVRLSLGAQAAAVLYFNPILTQDFTDFPVWYPDKLTPGSLAIATDRLIVDGFNHDFYASYHLSLSANYLVSSRLSFFGKLGAYLLPPFTPTSFTIGANVRDNTINSDADIDANGIFPQYQSFNFARNSAGDRISFSSMGLSVQLGMAFNF